MAFFPSGYLRRIASRVKKLDHASHFMSGLASLGAAAVAVGGAIYAYATHSAPQFLSAASTHQVSYSVLAALFGTCLFLAVVNFHLRKYKRLCDRLGAVFSEHMRDADLDYQARREAVERYKVDFLGSSKLYLLGATGYRTFVAHADPVYHQGEAILHPVLQNIANDYEISGRINVHILLIHPHSKYAIERAKDLNQPFSDYQKEIYDSISYCITLKKRIPGLRCFVYDRPPIWKLILTDSLVWQQFYTEKTHVEHSRVNIFSAPRGDNNQGNDLYTPFLKLFELLRESACLEVDLSAESPSVPSLLGAS